MTRRNIKQPEVDRLLGQASQLRDLANDLEDRARLLSNQRRSLPKSVMDELLARDAVPDASPEEGPDVLVCTYCWCVLHRPDEEHVLGPDVDGWEGCFKGSFPLGERCAEVDHVLPLSRGGRDAIDNLVLSCRSCNRKKGARTPAEWRADQLLSEVELPETISDRLSADLHDALLVIASLRASNPLHGLRLAGPHRIGLLQ